MIENLRQWLEDPEASGVYRANGADEIEAAVRASDLSLVHVHAERGGDKTAVLRAFANALGFPQWFGGNWDALEDCLTDLSWREARGHVLILEGFEALPAEDRSVLMDVLASSAQFWKETESRFFAIFLDAQRRLPLPEVPYVP